MGIFSKTYLNMEQEDGFFDTNLIKMLKSCSCFLAKFDSDFTPVPGKILILYRHFTPAPVVDHLCCEVKNRCKDV